MAPGDTRTMIKSSLIAHLTHHYPLCEDIDVSTILGENVLTINKSGLFITLLYYRLHGVWRVP